MKLLLPAGRALAALVILCTLQLSVVPSHAQDGEPPPACNEIDGFHRLDFWLGDWQVVDPDGVSQGTNRIEKVLDGCAILEHWTGTGGSRGMSLFYFNALNRTWKQVWITSRATVPGALKEKQLVEELPDGGLRFQGVVVLTDGRTIVDRTTLTPLEDGRVVQVIEWSRDGGVHWNETFHGIYLPTSKDSDGGAASIDLYRSRQLRIEELIDARGQELHTIARTAFGDTGAARSARDRVVDWLRRTGEFAYIDIAPIQYFGEEGPAVHLTVDLVDVQDRQERLDFLPAPTEQIADPDGLLEAWRRLESTTWRLLESGGIDPSDQAPCPVLHCLFGQHHPELAPQYEDLRRRTPTQLDAIATVLHHDADAADRAAAAFVLGTAADTDAVVAALLPAVRDRDATVRNNVMRVLGVIALEQPAVSVPLAPVLAAIDFPATTDRNKALVILTALSQREELREEIRAGAGERLLALLRLHQPNNRDWALRVLHNISGQTWGAEELERWQDWLGAASGPNRPLTRA